MFDYTSFLFIQGQLSTVIDFYIVQKGLQTYNLGFLQAQSDTNLCSWCSNS